MPAKLKRTLLVIVPIILIVIAVNLREHMIKNPIRSMYLAGKHHDYSELRSIEELEIHRDNSPASKVQLAKTINAHYKDEFLKDGFEVYLTLEKKRFDFYSRYNVTDEIILYTPFHYEPKNNTLYYEAIKIINYENREFGERMTQEQDVRRYLDKFGISDEDIRDIQRYIVYDVVITSWRSRHGDPPELIHNYNLNLEDQTYDFNG